MKELIFFLEEPSAKEMLKGLLNRMVNPDIKCAYIVFEGKSDLENNIVRKLRSWNNPHARFIVLRDKDSGNCEQIKLNLKQKCALSGKPDTLVRIACHELESWYIGDLGAVEKGLNLANLSKQQKKRKYRNPDNLANATEELMKLTNFKYQKIDGSRKIGPFMDLENNTSHSYRVFINGLKRVLHEASIR
ncbi:MAG: DUF4276 family protein [Candidatus Aminicenantes bacterium]|nr:DUF4276 family protein [Candidatus Aminicenantes bacterium]